MGRRVKDGGSSECRPVTGRIGVEPPGEITSRDSGLTPSGVSAREHLSNWLGRQSR